MQSRIKTIKFMIFNVLFLLLLSRIKIISFIELDLSKLFQGRYSRPFLFINLFFRVRKTYRIGENHENLF